MGKAIVFILLLMGLTAGFKIVAEWFREKKNINIIPASLIEMVAVIIFIPTYGSVYNDEIIWMWFSVAIVVSVTIFNLIKYGFKYGILASIAELIFSISAALLIIFILVSMSSKNGRKSNNRSTRKR